MNLSQPGQKSLGFERQMKKIKASRSKEKTNECRICKKMFKYASGLKRHMIVHTGEKPYVCLQCQKAFSFYSSLKTHARTHTVGEPYRCQLCDKVFRQLAHLKIHKRTHFSERPCNCQVSSKHLKQLKDTIDMLLAAMPESSTASVVASVGTAAETVPDTGSTHAVPCTSNSIIRQQETSARSRLKFTSLDIQPLPNVNFRKQQAVRDGSSKAISKHQRTENRQLGSNALRRPCPPEQYREIKRTAATDYTIADKTAFRKDNVQPLLRLPGDSDHFGSDKVVRRGESGDGSSKHHHNKIGDLWGCTTSQSKRLTEYFHDQEIFSERAAMKSPRSDYNNRKGDGIKQPEENGCSREYHRQVQKSRDRESETDRSKERSSDRDRERDLDRSRVTSRDRERDMNREGDGDRSRVTSRDRERDGNLERDGERSRVTSRDGERDGNRERDGDRSRVSSRDRERDGNREKDGDRSRVSSKDRERDGNREIDGDRSKVSSRDREREANTERDGDRSRVSSRDRERDGNRERDGDRSKVSSRDREREGNTERDGDRSRVSSRDRERDGNKERDGDRSKVASKDRERDGNRERDGDRSRVTSRDEESDGDRSKVMSRDGERDGNRERDRTRSTDRVRDRDGEIEGERQSKPMTKSVYTQTVNVNDQDRKERTSKAVQEGYRERCLGSTKCSVQSQTVEDEMEKDVVYAHTVKLERNVDGADSSCTISDGSSNTRLFLRSQRLYMVIPVSSSYNDYAQKVKSELVAAGFTCEADLNSRDTMNMKIVKAHRAQFNFILVVGEKEERNGTVNVRTRDQKILGEQSIAHLKEQFKYYTESKAAEAKRS